MKISTILTYGERPKNIKNQQKSVLIFKHEVPGICPVVNLALPLRLPCGGSL